MVNLTKLFHIGEEAMRHDWNGWKIPTHCENPLCCAAFEDTGREYTEKIGGKLYHTCGRSCMAKLRYMLTNDNVELLMKRYH